MLCFEPLKEVNRVNGCIQWALQVVMNSLYSHMSTRLLYELNHMLCDQFFYSMEE